MGQVTLRFYCLSAGQVGFVKIRLLTPAQTLSYFRKSLFSKIRRVANWPYFNFEQGGIIRAGKRRTRLFPILAGHVMARVETPSPEGPVRAVVQLTFLKNLK